MRNRQMIYPHHFFYSYEDPDRRKRMRWIPEPRSGKKTWSEWPVFSTE